MKPQLVSDCLFDIDSGRAVSNGESVRTGFSISNLKKNQRTTNNDWKRCVKAFLQQSMGTTFSGTATFIISKKVILEWELFLRPLLPGIPSDDAVSWNQCGRTEYFAPLTN